jgi:hypothetical protein
VHWQALRGAPQSFDLSRLKLLMNAGEQVTSYVHAMCCAVLCCAVLCCAVLCCADNARARAPRYGPWHVLCFARTSFFYDPQVTAEVCDAFLDRLALRPTVMQPSFGMAEVCASHFRKAQGALDC